MGSLTVVSGYKASRPSGVKLRFKLDRYWELAGARRWTTQPEHARGTGLSQQTVSRMLSDKKDWKPSPEAIAALLAAFDVDFDELFEVVRADTPARRAS
jgi:Predicted transcriptional regulators